MSCEILEELFRDELITGEAYEKLRSWVAVEREAIRAAGIKAISIEQKYRGGDSQAVWEAFEKSKALLKKLDLAAVVNP